ncbi:HYR-like domain-containing protein, partial [Winogradskyella pacifica]|uniref:HYR-like domain-containing protein n=1 Tax=Winogradskyella pacifica TaxID=664642 RepID=UPI000E258A5D
MKNHYLKVLTHVTSLALLLFIFSFSLSLNAQTEFMTTWKTDNLATSNETLRIKEESTHNDLFASAGYFGVDESYLVSPLKRNEPLQLEINHSTSSIFALTGCTSSFSINVASSTCGAVVTYTGPTSNIGSQHAHRTTGLPSGATFPIGVTTITFEEHDSGHTPTGSICTFTITVVDNEKPTASNPADINVQCLGDVPAADITVVTDEADNCGTPSVAFVSQTADPAINNGTITRTYSVTDTNGNSINVYQDIVILDNTDPTASNPADINVQCLSDVPAADITVVNDEADNCGTPTVAFVNQTADPAINNGTITRTYSVTDTNGNSINVYQDIVILDNTDPTASNPADINVQCLSDVPAADITVVNDEADNCGTPTVAFVNQTADPAI